MFCEHNLPLKCISINTLTSVSAGCQHWNAWSSGYGCDKAYDGIATVNYYCSANGQGVGAWIRFDVQTPLPEVAYVKVKWRDGEEDAKIKCCRNRDNVQVDRSEL